MFTVKHVDHHGSETIVQCDRFVRERRPDGVFQYIALEEKAVPLERLQMWCGIEEQRVHPDPARQAIYVMNRYGATVASYHFSLPSSHCVGGTQADPELVAAAQMAEAA